MAQSPDNFTPFEGVQSVDLDDESVSPEAEAKNYKLIFRITNEIRTVKIGGEVQEIPPEVRTKANTDVMTIVGDSNPSPLTVKKLFETSVKEHMVVGGTSEVYTIH